MYILSYRYCTSVYRYVVPTVLFYITNWTFSPTHPSSDDSRSITTVRYTHAPDNCASLVSRFTHHYYSCTWLPHSSQDWYCIATWLNFDVLYCCEVYGIEQSCCRHLSRFLGFILMYSTVYTRQAITTVLCLSIPSTRATNLAVLVHDLTTLYCTSHSDDISQIKVSTQGQKKVKKRYFFFKRFRNGKKDSGKKRILVRYTIRY